ncbi:MAG: phage portal protein [Desulfotignum sp.]|nr:phage portal protein [Desulfotignum sp.]
MNLKNLFKPSTWMADFSGPSAGKKPIAASGYPDVARSAASNRGTMANWVVQRINRLTESTQRTKVTDRAADMVANDPHAASTVDSMALNSVGTGLIAQSNPHQKILGWTDSQVKDFQENAEWAFALWGREADAAGRMPWWCIQFLTTYSLFVHGEYLRVPIVLDRPDRSFSFALQCLHPSRLATPRDFLSHTDIRDGVALTPYGAPQKYYIANPSDRFARTPASLSSTQFATVPAWIGHRPGCFHGFVQKSEEQVRGVSILAPAMKFFRDLSDYLDFELVGAIVAASFPVFIETDNPYDQAPQTRNGVPQPFTTVDAGGVYYGAANQKPHVLSPNRPGNTFPDFVERLLRTVGASVGMPYEVVAKDFSKTNYSSARAALLEAWRVYSFYQKWLVDNFCQRVWEMVMEESWLRGYLTLPRKDQDFYDIRQAACRARWIPPKRGHVDPVKEINAMIKALENDITTLADSAAEMSGGDWESTVAQRARERARQREANPEHT